MSGHYPKRHRRLVLNTEPNTICAAFAKGDFSSLANSFSQAGFSVTQPCTGVLQICATPSEERMRLIISVGVHGDETVPIEMMALLLTELSQTPSLLAVDLMVILANYDAVAQARRFIDVDLNRLFTSSQIAHTSEAQRAAELMHVTAQFFQGRQHKWHLDLHSAIRASLYPAFAIVPGKNHFTLLRWLKAAGFAAAVLHPQTSTTFSAYTCNQLGAVSCTAELGRTGVLGANDLTPFMATQRAIATLLRGEITHSSDQTTPLLFRVVQEVVKHSDAFEFTFDGNTPNFTEFAPRTILAKDGETIWSVGDAPEYVLFPNTGVRIGLRAGLMAVRVFQENG